MARPKKIGLDYFPMDVDIFTDRKVRKLMKKYDSIGFTVFSFILCEIYRDKGYWVQYDSDFIFDISDSLDLEENLVSDIVNYCVQIDIFNRRIFNHKRYLTSKKIQEVYVTGKRNNVLIDSEIGVFVTETKVIDTQTRIDDSTSTQSKVKESKVKESKEIEVPVFEEFKNFALEKKGELEIDSEKIRLKYESWKQNGWKNGNDKPIKNWKSSLLNTLPYLQKEKNSAKKEKVEASFEGETTHFDPDF